LRVFLDFLFLLLHASGATVLEEEGAILEAQIIRSHRRYRALRLLLVHLVATKPLRHLLLGGAQIMFLIDKYHLFVLVLTFQNGIVPPVGLGLRLLLDLLLLLNHNVALGLYLLSLLPFPLTNQHFLAFLVLFWVRRQVWSQVPCVLCASFLVGCLIVPDRYIIFSTPLLIGQALV